MKTFLRALAYTKTKRVNTPYRILTLATVRLWCPSLAVRSSALARWGNPTFTQKRQIAVTARIFFNYAPPCKRCLLIGWEKRFVSQNGRLCRRNQLPMINKSRE